MALKFPAVDVFFFTFEAMVIEGQSFANRTHICLATDKTMVLELGLKQLASNAVSYSSWLVFTTNPRV